MRRTEKTLQKDRWFENINNFLNSFLLQESCLFIDELFKTSENEILNLSVNIIHMIYFENSLYDREANYANFFCYLKMGINKLFLYDQEVKQTEKNLFFYKQSKKEKLLKSLIPNKILKLLNENKIEIPEAIIFGALIVSLKYTNDQEEIYLINFIKIFLLFYSGLSFDKKKIENNINNIIKSTNIKTDTKKLISDIKNNKAKREKFDESTLLKILTDIERMFLKLIEYNSPSTKEMTIAMINQTPKFYSKRFETKLDRFFRISREIGEIFSSSKNEFQIKKIPSRSRSFSFNS